MNRKYNSDYELREEPNSNGRGSRTKAVYTGAYWQYRMEPRQYRAFGLLLKAVLAGMTALYVGMGLLRTGSMGFGGAAAPYVLLPYVAVLLPLGMCWGKTLALPRAARPLERREYEQWVLGRRRYSTALLVCAAAAGVGGLAYVLLHRRAATLTSDLLFCLLAGGVCAASVLFIRIQDRYPCETPLNITKNDGQNRQE